jgi:hypothetical protein
MRKRKRRSRWPSDPSDAHICQPFSTEVSPGAFEQLSKLGSALRMRTLGRDASQQGFRQVTLLPRSFIMMEPSVKRSGHAWCLSIASVKHDCIRGCSDDAHAWTSSPRLKNCCVLAKRLERRHGLHRYKVQHGTC